MNIFLTGGTGFIGSRVLTALIAHGHRVSAMVRSDVAGKTVTEAGAVAVLGDITDSAWLAERFAEVDAVIHTASPGDDQSPVVDAAAARAAVTALTGTSRPYVHTGGVWAYGAGDQVSEATPYSPPALTAWRGGVENIVLDAPDLAAVLITPSVVYGHGQGLPNLITRAPRDEHGALRLIGDGTQHWPLVHVDDLADLYLRAVENPSARGVYIAASAQDPTVRDLAEAAAQTVGAGVRPETREETYQRFGAYLGEALMLDQRVVSTRAHDDLGWTPSAAPLLTDIATGSYRL